MNDHVTEIDFVRDDHTDIERRFRAMHKASRTEAAPDAGKRKAQLIALRDMLTATSDEFADAICRDYGWRSRDETMLAEIVPSLTLLRDALRNVQAWMRRERRGISLPFWPGRNRIYWQPKGVVLIIAPWNYPLLLAVGPLIAALAAGNRVILKPSELTPATAEMLRRRIAEAFDPEWVTVATGDADLAAMLCRLPFDHILFTGSTAIGQKVMQAAAANLTPVTLELGGKSPAILHADFDVALAADRIARGKLMNAGQTCIAPDYVLVPADRLGAFAKCFGQAVARLYPRLADNPDYSAIIDKRHYDRLARLATDARANGARLIPIDPAGELPDGEVGWAERKKLAPVLLTATTDAMAVMREEIFGPLLPLVPYETLDQAIAHVNARPRPLALYYFDTDPARIERVLQQTVSGGATVNDTIYHFAQEALPFGGIGPSGMGAYHGRDGFRTFSHGKTTFHQSRFTLTSLLTPPYGRLFARAMRLAVRRDGGR